MQAEPSYGIGGSPSFEMLLTEGLSVHIVRCSEVEKLQHSYGVMPVLKFFGSPTCPKCSQSKERLHEHKIPFKYYNMMTAKGLAEAAYHGVVDEQLPVLILVDQEGEVLKRFRAVLQAISEMERRYLVSQNKQMSIELPTSEPGTD